MWSAPKQRPVLMEEQQLRDIQKTENKQSQINQESPSYCCAHAFNMTPLTLVCRSKERDTKVNMKKKLSQYPANNQYDHRNNSNKIIIFSYNLIQSG